MVKVHKRGPLQDVEQPDVDGIIPCPVCPVAARGPRQRSRDVLQVGQHQSLKGSTTDVRASGLWSFNLVVEGFWTNSKREGRPV